MYSPDSPASMSIHEEATFVAEGPMMGVFNNLVLFDQHVKQNSLDSIVPDLAKSWSWNEEGTELTMPLRDGVSWHDGKPFTAKDVQCTFDLLTGKSSEKLRVNPRGKSWYRNLDAVTPNGDYEVTFHLKRPQPAFLMVLASGYSPVYPCHIAPRDMRQHPIGTGPFKFVEFKPNEHIKVARNPDYWKEGRPYLDGIEYTIIRNLSTAILAFVAGKFDMTFGYGVTAPLLKDVTSQMPEAICELAPIGVNRSLIINRDQPPFDNPDLRRAMGLSFDRTAFIDIVTQGQGDIGGVMQPPPSGVWGMPRELLRNLPGYDPDVAKNRAEGRRIMEKLGYGPNKRLPVTVSTRNLAPYRDPAVIMIDQLKEVYIDGELNPIGVNCLRSIPLAGPVIWGARTCQGADLLTSEWKYVPIRRTALFIEESLRRGTQWIVFEPNDEPLWAAIRLNVGAFMQGLFLQGAFQGTSPQQAYFVKCDAENNPQASIDLGVVNILVGFAPLYPAEFVVIQIQQIAGQVA